MPICSQSASSRGACFRDQPVFRHYAGWMNLRPILANLMTKKKRANKKRKSKNYVIVSSGSYGAALRGQRIYFEGAKPKKLANDGRITFGKNILEILKVRFGRKFGFIITAETNSIETKYGISNVRVSQQMLNRMFSENFERSREVKNDIVQRRFFAAFPTYFTTPPPGIYSAGSVAKFLSGDAVKRFSSEDKGAINRILPAFLSGENMSSLAIKAVEIDSLRKLATEFREELENQHTENWWQIYIQARILIM